MEFLNSRRSQHTLLTMQREQGVGGYEAGFQVGQGLYPVVVGGVAVRFLFDSERYEESELGYLAGDGLDIHAEDAVLYEVEFASEVGFAVFPESVAYLCQFLMAFGTVGGV